TFSQSNFASVRMALRFSIHCLVSFFISPSIKFPVTGSKGICPEIYKVLPIRTAWLYGPIGAGAFGVLIIFFTMYLFDVRCKFNPFGRNSSQLSMFLLFVAGSQEEVIFFGFKFYLFS